MDRVRQKRSRSSVVRRVGACSLGSLLVLAIGAGPAFAVAPDAPTGATALSGEASLTVGFTAPVNNGGNPITSYTATCTDGTNSFPQGGTSSPIVVTGLTDGTSYTCTVTATNSDGTSVPSGVSAAATPDPTAPSAPAQPVVTRGNSSLIVAFTPPAANGSPITGYTATCVGTPIRSASGAGTPLTVTGLTIGNSYTCHVTATNGIGTSAPSLDSSPASVVAGIPSAPSAPSAVKGSGQATVSFSAPSSNGSPITGYTASCTDGTNSFPASGVGSPITVMGLTNGVSYVCNVAATNAIGTGPPSPNSGPIVPSATPDAPAQPSATSGDTVISVGFTPPSNNGFPITSYTATCTPVGGGPLAFASGAGSPIMVGGVTNTKAYTCHVTATNSQGTSPASPESAQVIPAGRPAQPAAPTVTPGNGSIVVSFVPPNNEGSPITMYQAACDDGTNFFTANGSSSPITVTGLTNGVAYSCEVIATNAVGVSDSSDASVFVTPDAVPGAPTKPTVTAGSGRIVVSFDLPVDNGDSITTATATCTSSNGGITRAHANTPTDEGETFSPITVTSLTNGKSYTCKVTASNDVGTGPASPASNAIVPRTPPGAPTGVSLASGKATGALGPMLVSFKAGAANGSPITSFRAACTDQSTGLKTLKTGTFSPITVTGLVAGHTYSCTVVDISAGGTSVASAAAKGILGTPAAPTIAKVTQKNHGLTVAFFAPSGNGHPITQYQVHCTSTNGGIKRGGSGIGSPVLVTNMSVGRSYVCTLNAINVRGTGAPRNFGPLTISK